MATAIDQATIDDLLNRSTESLYEQLGMRQIASDRAAEAAADAEGVAVAGVTVGPITLPGPEDFARVGRQYFAKYGSQAYELFCGTDERYAEERRKIEEAARAGQGAVGAALGGAIVLWFPVAAPIAVLVATIIVKLAYDAAHGLACDSLKAEVPETVAAAS